MKSLYGNFGIDHHLGYEIIEAANLNAIDTQLTDYFNKCPTWWIEDDRNIAALAITLSTGIDELSASKNL